MIYNKGVLKNKYILYYNVFQCLFFTKLRLTVILQCQLNLSLNYAR